MSWPCAGVAAGVAGAAGVRENKIESLGGGVGLKAICRILKPYRLSQAQLLAAICKY